MLNDHMQPKSALAIHQIEKKMRETSDEIKAPPILDEEEEL